MKTTSTETNASAAGKVAASIKLAYGFGDIGSNIFIVTSGFFLLFFLTNVLGINPALAGMALLFPKLWDVVSDPIMGAMSDRTRSRWGRRRPYLLYGALPFGLTFFLMFIDPGYASETARALHVGLVFASGAPPSPWSTFPIPAWWRRCPTTITSACRSPRTA